MGIYSIIQRRAVEKLGKKPVGFLVECTKCTAINALRCPDSFMGSDLQNWGSELVTKKKEELDLEFLVEYV